MKIHTSLSSLLPLAFLVFCTGALGTVSLHAQDTPPPPPQQDGRGPGGPGGRGPGGPEMQQRQLDRMTRELSLTPDQVTSIKAIQDDGRKQAMALRDDTSTAGPDKHAKMMSMRDAEQVKVRAVLTDDQKVKYDAMLEKMKHQRERRQDGADGPPPPPPSSPNS